MDQSSMAVSLTPHPPPSRYEDLGAALCVTVAVNVTMPRLRSIFMHVRHFLTRVLKKGRSVAARCPAQMQLPFWSFDLAHEWVVGMRWA